MNQIEQHIQQQMNESKTTSQQIAELRELLHTQNAQMARQAVQLEHINKEVTRQSASLKNHRQWIDKLVNPPPILNRIFQRKE
jgi:septal ring factor EnvC (AmiA/AmiB activator)